jgi:hypothetical protein
MIDPTEVDIIAGAIAALRKRAARQIQLAKDGTTSAEDGSPILTGEAAIALRVAKSLFELIDELEREAAPPCLPA